MKKKRQLENKDPYTLNDKRGITCIDPEGTPMHKAKLEVGTQKLNIVELWRMAVQNSDL